MKNKLIDLNNHLFEQLERLNDDDLVGKKLEEEIKRSTAMANISSNIINNAALVLKAKKYNDDNGVERTDLPEMLLIEPKGK